MCMTSFLAQLAYFLMKKVEKSAETEGSYHKPRQRADHPACMCEHSKHTRLLLSGWAFRNSGKTLISSENFHVYKDDNEKRGWNNSSWRILLLLSLEYPLPTPRDMQVSSSHGTPACAQNKGSIPIFLCKYIYTHLLEICLEKIWLAVWARKAAVLYSAMNICICKS